MGPPTAARQGLAALFALLLVATLVWALLHFGATETAAVYTLFLLLAAVALPAAVLLPATPFRRPGAATLLAVGALLVAQTARLPTLEARGYLHWAIGCLAWALALGIASHGPRLQKALYGLLVLVGTFEALFGLLEVSGRIQPLARHPEIQRELAIGTLINPNHFAGLLAMSGCLMVGLLAWTWLAARQRRRYPWMAWPVGLSLLAIAGLAMSRTQSHGGLLAVSGAGAAIVLLAGYRRLTLRSGRQRPLLLLAAVMLLALVAVLGLRGSATGARLLSAQNRAEIYRDTLGLIRDHPLTGVGPGMYGTRFRAYQTVNLKNRYFHAHNDLLETAAEWGLPVAALFWCFLAWRGCAAARRFGTDRDPWRAGAGLGCAAAIGALAIHSLVDFNLQIPANLMFLAIVVGLAQSLETAAPGVGSAEEGPGGVGSPGGRRGALSRLAGPAVRLLLVLLLAAAGSKVLDRRLALELMAADPGLPGIEAALARDPANPQLHFRRGVLLRDRPDLADRAGSLTAFERAVELDPYSWRYWWELARTRELARDVWGAGEAYQRAVDLNPQDHEYRWRLANFWLRAGERERFLDELGRSIIGRKTPRRAAFALLLKSGGSPEEIDRVWPRDQAARFELLRWLATTPSPWTVTSDPVREVELLLALWRGMVRGGTPPTVAEGSFLVERLAARGRGAEARQAWLELAAAAGLDDPAYRAAANLLWNGGFELSPTGAGLDWRLAAGEEAVAHFVPGEGEGGSKALELRPTPRRAAAARQRAALAQPGAHELGLALRAPRRAEIRVEVEIRDGTSRELLRPTVILQPSERWASHSLRFEVRQDNLLIELHIRAVAATRSASSPPTSVWLDSVTVAAVAPESQS